MIPTAASSFFPRRIQFLLSHVLRWVVYHFLWTKRRKDSRFYYLSKETDQLQTKWSSRELITSEWSWVIRMKNSPEETLSIGRSLGSIPSNLSITVRPSSSFKSKRKGNIFQHSLIEIGPSECNKSHSHFQGTRNCETAAPCVVSFVISFVLHRHRPLQLFLAWILIPFHSISVFHPKWPPNPISCRKDRHSLPIILLHTITHQK